LFLGFIRFLDSRDNSALGGYLRKVRGASFYNSGVGGFSILGVLVHKAFHEHKQEFQALLLEYLSAMGWVSNETERTLFEMDYLLQPKLYANSERDLEESFLTSFKVTQRDGDKLHIRYSGSQIPDLSEPRLKGLLDSSSKIFAIDYERGDHMPFDAAVGSDFYYGFWSRKMRGEVRSVSPALNPV
jgi:hypothetical protein